MIKNKITKIENNTKFIMKIILEHIKNYLGEMRRRVWRKRSE